MNEPESKIIYALSRAGLLFAFLFLCGSPTRAAAAGRPYAVLVNGNDDCCVWSLQGDGITGMTGVVRELFDLGAEVRLVPWNHFADRQKQSGRPLNDEPFLREAAEFLNRLDPDRPLILIGHSFGGDSLVKLAERIRRPIDVLAVLDPTASWGRRKEAVERPIPTNVRFFFNRWQSNRWAYYNTFPLDNRTQPGTFRSCRLPTICNDVEQNICRRADGSPITERCGFHEVTCSGWPSGTKQKRLIHTDMPWDALIQKELGTLIRQAVSSPRIP